MTEQSSENVTNKQASEQTSSGLAPKRLIPLAVIVGGLVVFFAVGGHEYLSFSMLAENRVALLDWYAANSLLAAVVFWIGYALAVAFSLPGAVW